MRWLTRPAPEYEVPNIDWITALFPGSKKYDGKPDPRIKSWGNPVGALKDILKNICSLKGLSVLCPYRWPNGLKEFSSGSTHKEWKYYRVIIHHTYHGGNIETDHPFRLHLFFRKYFSENTGFPHDLILGFGFSSSFLLS